MYKSKIGLAVLVATIVSFSVFVPNSALSQKPYAGVELQYVTTSPMVTSQLDQEFEKLTGVKVNVTSVAYPDAHPKLVVPFATKQPIPDLFIFDDVWTGEFGKAGWFVPVEDYLTKEEKAELLPVAREMYTYNGHLVGFAMLEMPIIMFYNEKMLSQAGYKPAETWDEFIAQLRVMKAAGLFKYGITWSLDTGRGLVSDTFTSLLLSQGGRLFDEEWDPRFNSKPGVEALQFVLDTLFEFKIASPTSMEADKRESLIPFMHGENPYNLNWQFMYPLTIDPKESSIAEYSKCCLNPGKPGAVYTGIAGGGAVGINPYSKHKEAAIEYAKFITSKENALRNFKNKGWMPWWSSLYEDPKALAIEPQLPILKTQLERSEPRPLRNWYEEYFKIMQIEISKAWLDKKVTAKEALDNAAKKVSELIAKYGR